MWQPIETAPVGMTVLCKYPDGQVATARLYIEDEGERYWDTEGVNGHTFVKWRPIPADTKPDTSCTDYALLALVECLFMGDDGTVDFKMYGPDIEQVAMGWNARKALEKPSLPLTGEGYIAVDGFGNAQWSLNIPSQSPCGGYWAAPHADSICLIPFYIDTSHIEPGTCISCATGDAVATLDV